MPPITELKDIDAGILHFEAVMRDYGGAGGAVRTDDELKEDLNDSLPRQISEHLAGRATEVKESFHASVQHVRTTANGTLFHGRDATSSLRLVAELRGEPGQDDGEYQHEPLAPRRRHPQKKPSNGRPGGGSPVV